MIKMILILELIFRCEACCCIFANKAAESYGFFSNQTSPTSLAQLVESVKNSVLRNVWETCWIPPTFWSFLTDLETELTELFHFISFYNIYIGLKRFITMYVFQPDLLDRLKYVSKQNYGPNLIYNIIHNKGNKRERKNEIKVIPDYSCSLKVFREGVNLAALSRLFHSFVPR